MSLARLLDPRPLCYQVCSYRALCDRASQIHGCSEDSKERKPSLKAEIALANVFHSIASLAIIEDHAKSIDAFRERCGLICRNFVLMNVFSTANAMDICFLQKSYLAISCCNFRQAQALGSIETGKLSSAFIFTVLLSVLINLFCHSTSTTLLA